MYLFKEQKMLQISNLVHKVQLQEVTDKKQASNAFQKSCISLRFLFLYKLNKNYSFSFYNYYKKFCKNCTKDLKNRQVRIHRNFTTPMTLKKQSIKKNPDNQSNSFIEACTHN